MPLHHNVSATWKNSTLWHNVAGTWKKVALHHNVSGVWKSITQLLSVTLPASIGCNDFAISTTDAHAYLYINNNGTWSGTGAGSGTWMDGGTASEYDVRLTQTSGTTIGGTLGTWMNLATSRNWVLSETRNGFFSSSAAATLEIRMAASPYTVLDTATVTFEATVEV